MKESTAKLLWLTLVTTSTPAASTVEPIAGTVASVWLRPSQLPGGTPFHTNSGETFWGNASQLEHWYKVREQDAKLLLDSLGHHRNASTLLYFEHYLADDCAWGPDPLERFVEAALFWSNRGVRPIAFFGAPEFHGHGNLTHDVSLHRTHLFFYCIPWSISFNYESVWCGIIYQIQNTGCQRSGRSRISAFKYRKSNGRAAFISTTRLRVLARRIIPMQKCPWASY